MVSHAIAPTTYGGRESKFGFVAVFRTENELGIVENISVDCKGDSTDGYNLFLTIEIADDDNKNHLLTFAFSHFTFSLLNRIILRRSMGTENLPVAHTKSSQNRLPLFAADFADYYSD